MAADIPAAAPVASLLPPGSTPALTAPARISTAGCRGAKRRAAVCLINRLRARSGLRGLHADRRLARAAARHAADMARHNYFGHFSLSGTDPLRRARAAGWRRGVGETLAWGCGSLSSPAAAVRAWMNSPPHRAILLGRGHSIGIAVKRGAGCAGGRIYWVAEVG
jgi:uncharacterized protein YkwD